MKPTLTPSRKALRALRALSADERTGGECVTREGCIVDLADLYQINLKTLALAANISPFILRRINGTPGAQASKRHRRVRGWGGIAKPSEVIALAEAVHVDSQQMHDYLSQNG